LAIAEPHQAQHQARGNSLETEPETKLESEPDSKADGEHESPSAET
jgi:hypothetical protein